MRVLVCFDTIQGLILEKEMATGHFPLHVLSAGQDLVGRRARARLILCLLLAAEDGSVT